MQAARGRSWPGVSLLPLAPLWWSQVFQDSSSITMSVATVQISNRKMIVVKFWSGDHRVALEAVCSIVPDKIAGVSFGSRAAKVSSEQSVRFSLLSAPQRTGSSRPISSNLPIRICRRSRPLHPCVACPAANASGVSTSRFGNRPRMWPTFQVTMPGMPCTTAAPPINAS